MTDAVDHGSLFLGGTRHWCEALAARAVKQVIERDGLPYLTRYFLAGWNPHYRRPAPAAFLHHFVASDPRGTVHSHPWDAMSIILVGAYREFRCNADGTPFDVRDYREGEINYLTTVDRHRIELLTRDCWTLFLAGEYMRDWEFFPSC